MDRETLAQLRHELRTPLNHIIGYAELLIEDGGQAELAPRLRAVLDDAQALLGLINELLGPAAAESLDAAQELAPKLAPPIERILASSQTIEEQMLAAGAAEAAKDAGHIHAAASLALRSAAFCPRLTTSLAFSGVLLMKYWNKDVKKK